MNYKKTTIFGSIIVATLLATFVTSGVVDSSSVGNLDRTCMSPEQSKEVTTFNKMPTEFIGDYSIRCISVDNPNEVYMIISDKPVTSNRWQSESVQPSGNSIFLHAIDESKFLTVTDYEELGSAEKRIKDTIADIQKKNPIINVQYLNINGMHAYGSESCKDCGIQTANFADGNVIQHTYDVPSKLKIIDDTGVRYSFYGNVPLDDLVIIAKSLK